MRCEYGCEVGGDAQDTACDEAVDEVEARAEDGVERTGKPHKESEEARAGEVADALSSSTFSSARNRP
jgi:hypothetical protein